MQPPRGTLLPRIEFNQEFLSLVVAVIGTTLSHQEVEEEIAKGRETVEQRKGATHRELRESRRDILFGMIFSNVIMYFIILATGGTLHAAGRHDIETAAQAAEALRPIAGEAAGLLFASGLIGVGFLAVPVMTAGAAYNLAQAFKWKHSLHAKWYQAKKFYAAIAAVTTLAVGLNFLGFNPMKALVRSGVVQGFSVPPLLLLIMLMTNNRKVMGDQVNSRVLNALGWLTTAAVTLASAALVATWFV